jgi:RimJ/RimL family protein N-acetyltransferase
MALIGERTRLRAVEPADAERAYRWVNDLEVTEHLSLRYPMSMATEEQWAERWTRSNDYRNVALAIETLEGEHIGNCGLHDGSPEERTAELGVLIGEKQRWGHGYGFDALRTLLCFGFREMNLRRIWLRVDEDHERGIALYERLGFHHEGRMRGAHWRRGRAVDFLVMGIAREEFDARYAGYDGLATIDDARAATAVAGSEG